MRTSALSRAASAALLAFGSAGCTPEPAPVGLGAGAARGACEEASLVSLVNDPATGEATLTAIGVYVLGARNLVAVRDGADRVPGTADDHAFASVLEIDLTPQVGTSSMLALDAWAAKACAVAAETIFAPQPYADSHVARLVEVVDATERSIDAAIYSFSDAALRDALGRAVARGVSVRVLFQNAPSEAGKSTSWSASLEDRGIEVRGVNKILHHKFLLADGVRTSLDEAAEATVVTSSGNWSNSSATKFDENTIVLRGDRRVALSYQAEFDDLWAHSRPYVRNEALVSAPSLPVTREDAAAADGAEVLFTSENFSVSNSSRYGWTWSKDGSQQHVVGELVALIGTAQESLWIASGHFRSRPIAEAVVRQAQLYPDLEVRVYLDGQEYTSEWTFEDEESDYAGCMAEALDDQDRLVCGEMGNHFGYLLVDAGVPVRYKTYAYRWDYSYAPQMHDKYLIVDGDVVATGSYNYSFTAEYDTFENVVVLDRSRYPEIVDAFVANHAALWDTARDQYAPLLDTIEHGTGAVPLVFPSMALGWSEVDALKDALRAACPAIDSTEYRDAPAAHTTCPR